MAKAVKISDRLVDKASVRASVMHRSTAGQIEYWANIGQIVEENPDLPFLFIQDILMGVEEAKSGMLEPYVFGEGKRT